MLQNMDSRACLPIRPACPHEPEHLTLVIDFCKKWWTRIATKGMAFIGIVTLAASLVASWLKQFPGFSLFGALIIALLIGMIIQFPIRKWYVGASDKRKAGVKDAAGLISNKLLRLGIILLGFKLNLAVLFTQPDLFSLCGSTRCLSDDLLQKRDVFPYQKEHACVQKSIGASNRIPI